MAKIEITVRAESPLSLGLTKGYGGTLIESGQYITGSHLRGALGAIKQYLSPTERDDIDKILGAQGRTGLHLPNCYPSGGGATYPLPLTARSCKRAEGFHYDAKLDEKKHGVSDTLLAQLAYDHVFGSEAKDALLPFKHCCDKCGGRTERFVGFAERVAGHKYVKPYISQHRQTRVAINRARLTAEQSQLYTVQAIDEGSMFIGIAHIPDESADLSQEWLKRIDRLGGRTSRGFGRVSVDTKRLSQSQTVYSRIQSFNDEYKNIEAEMFALAPGEPRGEERTLFTINLLSDALLRTPEGLPTLTLNKTMLRNALSELIEPTEQAKAMLGKLNLELITQFTQPMITSGWQTSWKLPKEVLQASRMGGLYVFAANAGDLEAKASLTSLLEKLEAEGIGDMREDGYGQVGICDLFHQEVIPI